MTLCRLFSLGIGITKVHCIPIAPIRLVDQQHFELSFFQNSHSLAFFSAKSANPTIFRMRILLAFSLRSLPALPFLLVTEIFLCEAYRFQKTLQTSDAQKNTPFV